MDAFALYESWISFPNHPQEVKADLLRIAGDVKQIEDRFYKDLEFGTGGLRGVLGAGTNRMNVYTVRRASLGFARFLLQNVTSHQERAVVIGYDCRNMSREFAVESGTVFAAAGIKAYVFSHLCPTPELSYAVREVGAAGGVMITASHNPPEYNGYKVYGGDGGQLLPEAAEQVTEQISAVVDLFDIPLISLDEAINQGRFEWIGNEMDESYVAKVVESIKVKTVNDSTRERLVVVYSPLHGTGNIPVRQSLAISGYHQVKVVASQELPDGNFSTVKSPNPEERSAFEKALTVAADVGADIVLATDPDADRVGVAVRVGDEYTLLTGNQTGGLLLDFLIGAKEAEGTLPKDATVFKTIVTSELGAVIARAHGVDVEDTLTGFKYIGERIGHYEKHGGRTFLFGYEESYGYLIAPFVRDKDAVQSCLLICEMAAWYKSQGKTLMEGLLALYERYGYYREDLISETLPGADGLAKIRAIMEKLREKGISVEGMALHAVEDYLTQQKLEGVPSGERRETPITLPKSDVLRYLFTDGSWLAVRPSGTEPKIKVYLGATAPTMAASEDILRRMRETVRTWLT